MEEPRKGFDEPIGSTPIYDKSGHIVGYEGDKNYMGIKQMYGPGGETIGWSKDGEGGLPFTSNASGERVSHGENPHLLFSQPQSREIDDIHREHFEREPIRWGQWGTRRTE